ncbi:hypothetical protein LSTR_LSTR012676 [Laodelphax striatellus]|uniref:G-protein coupled receptors family 1 profile domain-containing protein n=1 Tax=Laodelphax striatellus TaxID=195883 RepID=A0A482XI74_LAOST|nr:hypothetical protein LSTR_LSTR012676 [Laodelphax striatellus]
MLLCILTDLMLPQLALHSCSCRCFAGNVFVIAAILLERHLQSVANYLILHLADTDLLVACLQRILDSSHPVGAPFAIGGQLPDTLALHSCSCHCFAGNVFLIAAILLERHLQSVANYLILSLAVADLLVACLVMPLGAVYQVSQQWTLGPELCDMWTSSDVLCCTASILHLVAIALDRYWAVTNIDYIHQRTGKRIGLMILVIWCVSFLVCIAPLLGWKDPGWETRVSQERMCLVSQDIGYQIFATLASFYLPLLVILVLYWRIFQTARKRIRRRVTVATPPTGAGGGGAGGKGGGAPPGGVIAGLCAAGAAGGSGGIAAAVVGVIGRPLPTISEATTTTTTTTAFTNVSSANTSPEKGSFGNGLEPDPPTCDPISSVGPPGGGGYPGTVYHLPPKARKAPKESAETKRERKVNHKAAKTLAIITGAFVVCWLPFFVMAVLLPGDSGLFHQYVIAFFLWLGYFNSTLNPVIYTVFSPEFRHAFKRLLCGRRASVRRRAAHHHFAAAR